MTISWPTISYPIENRSPWNDIAAHPKAIAGLRHGEVAALRWRELDYTAEPLARIHVVRAYNSATGQIKTTKTGDGRGADAPDAREDHRHVAAVNWSRLYGRQPTLDDLVVPTRNGTPIDACDAVHAFRPTWMRSGCAWKRVSAGIAAATTCAAGTRPGASRMAPTR